jgi:hypothetical protein
MSAEKGRPPGSRDQLTSDFIAKLADDFEANGEAAIERCRMDDPAAYLRLVASLAPKNEVCPSLNSGARTSTTNEVCRQSGFAARWL